MTLLTLVYYIVQ